MDAKYFSKAAELESKLLNILERMDARGLDYTLEEVINALLLEEIPKYILENDLEITLDPLVNAFKRAAEGTEFGHPLFYSHFQTFLLMHGINLNIQFEIGEKNKPLPKRIKISSDEFGAVGDWAAAIDKTRFMLGLGISHPLEASSFWRRFIIDPELYGKSPPRGYKGENLYHKTMSMRLSQLPMDSAAYVNAISLGTGDQVIAGRGGVPYPSYAGKGDFIQLTEDEINFMFRDAYNNLYNYLYSKALDSIQSSIPELRIPLTETLEKALSALSRNEALRILQTLETSVDIDKKVYGIINIGNKAYDIVKTKSGKFGLRYRLHQSRRL